VALGVALEHPERVAALVLVAPAVGFGNPLPPWVRALLATPQARRLGPLLLRRVEGGLPDALRRAWHDPGRVTPEVEAGYARPLRAKDWDRGLWEVLLASRPGPPLPRLSELQVPVLVVVGDDDRLVSPERGRELAARIPGAELVVLSACGHLPQEERPAEFLAALEAFLLRHGIISGR
ncbi:MAG: alpha/beta hydrolase, partial [Candidatus Bipolaricaulota bacterium]|nr:alpha/beta hydrolase [Candidatus Bipolaricaulota bacterium]